MTLATRPKPSAHQKKRTGLHQRRSKQFVKTYWPYLPLLLVVLSGFALNALWPQPKNVLGETSTVSALALLDSTNAVRRQMNEPELTINDKLAQAAQAKANDMVLRNYWSHDTPDGKTPWTFITTAGYSYQKAGENLAYGFTSAQDTLQGWMTSPTHRANVLGADYRNVGFGIASSQNYQGKGPETVIVAMYGEPAAATNNLAVAQTTPADTSGSIRTIEAKPVARVQLLTGGQDAWSVFVLSSLASVGVIIFLVRHGRYWHKALVKEEQFVIAHPVVDFAVVSIVTLCFVLSRAGGFIG